MAVLKQIPNDIMLNLPNTSEAAVSLSSVVAQVGCTADQMTEALKKLSYLMNQVDWATTEITAIKDSLEDMRYDIERQDAGLQCQIDLVDMKLNELRPATDTKTENPKQKSDLEILSQIEPSTAFLILGDIGWSEDICNMTKTNMFLN